jgi:uncharacterized membrane protein
MRVEGEQMTYSKAVLVGMLLALGLTSPGLAHKDHNKKTQAAATAPIDHSGMNHGTSVPRASNLPAGAPDTAATDAASIEIGEHDERQDLAETKPFFVRLLDWLGRFHTAVVHFPVGLTLGAVIAEIIGLRRRDEKWRWAARVMLGIAAVGAIISVALGWINAGFYMVDTDGVLTAHRWLGTALAVLGVLVAHAAGRSTRRPDEPHTLYWTLLAATGLAMAVQGYLGGSLVHGGLDHLAF